jgi:putative ABC transport system permease protein
MFISYIRIMIRNMIRQKSYATITIAGLTVGITFAMLIGVFVWTELQVNQNLKDVDRLFLIEAEQKEQGSMPAFFVPAVLGERAVEKYPQAFEDCYRFRDRAITISKGDKHLRIQSMIGDSTLVGMFGFQVLHGNPLRVLDKPDAIVLTEKTALQFFDHADVIGEFLTVSTENDGLQDYQITAVIADPPKKNSVSDFMNMDAQVFLSHSNRASFNLGGIDDWGASIITYIKLAPTTSKGQAAQLLNTLLKDEAPDDVKKDKTISLMPLSNYYLITNHRAVRKLIISLTLITIFILLLAIVNFVNITIARSFSRFREVGVRKVIGGIRKQVLVQFLAEAVMFAALSLFFSILLYEMLHRYAGNSLNMELPSISDFPLNLWTFIIGGTLLIGLAAGAYPALYLSATKPTELLKGKFKSVKGTIHFSRALVAVQFVVAIFIFTVSIIMSKQISYFLEADLGYDKSRVMIVSSVPRLWNEEGFSKMNAARTVFLSSSNVESVSLSWGAPNFNFSPYSAKINKPGSSLDDGIVAVVSATDEHYADVYGLNVIAGKFFFDEGEFHSNNRIVINESAQKALSLQPGDKLRMEFSDQELTITGIVKDFNFESFHKPIQPIVFVHTTDFQAFRYFSFQLTPGKLDESVREVEQIWKKVFPNDPFIFHFTDERMAVIYQTELQLKKAAVIASVLILVIIMTGVLGLVSLNVARRTKEIGIRKVLGATIANILVLVSSEYVLIMLLSFAVGVPLSIMFGWRWLSNFAYRVNLEWWIFILPVVFLTVMTLLVVIAQSIKTSLSNPVTSLRDE